MTERVDASPQGEAGSGAAHRPRHILVIEDDQSISLGLQMNLEAEGYRVSVAADGDAGLELARSAAPDLIILDIMLPGLNGLELLRRLRAGDCQVPTIVLSARDTELDIVMGLEFGAEDYVRKPFGLAELLARIKTVLRRSNPGGASEPAQPEPSKQSAARPAPQPRVKVGALSVDADTRQVWRDGQAVSLTATEFDVLWCLVRGRGRVLAREEIQASVWGPEHHGTLRTIDNFMMQLRTKLEKDPADPEYLLTVRGVGYRLEMGED